MKGLVLCADWDPRPEYALSDWEKQTGKAIAGNAVWRNPRLEVTDAPEPGIAPDQGQSLRRLWIRHAPLRD